MHLITNRWRCEPDAAEATLIDLAARGFLQIERRGDQPEHAVCRVTAKDTSSLARYEKWVWHKVHDAASIGEVPLAGLASGPAAGAWQRAFAREVAIDARSRKLSRARISDFVQAAFITVGIVPALAVGAAAAAYFQHVLGLIAAAAVFAALIKATFTIRGERDTPAGRAAAAHWLGVRSYLRAHSGFSDLPPSAVTLWQRYLAYGCALGVAGETLRVLELGRAERRTTWSAYSGTWRKVRIRFVRRPGWGVTTSRAYSLGAMWFIGGLVIGGWFGLTLGPEYPTFAKVVFVLAALMGFVGLQGLVRATIDVFAPLKVHGQVLRLHDEQYTVVKNRRRYTKIRHFLVVDDGMSPKVTAFVIGQNVREFVKKDDIIRFKVGRNYGFVHTVTRTKRAADWRKSATRKRQSVNT